MKMQFLPLFLGLLSLTLPNSISADDAAQTGADELGAAARSQDLDAFWSDQQTWLDYGYRPHVQSRLTHFTSYPSSSSSLTPYTYGLGATPLPSLNNPLDKQSVQLTKFGTWH